MSNIPIKLCIFGGMDLFPSNATIEDELYQFLSHQNREITEVVCGMAKGADEAGRRWATSNGIKITPFYAKWTEYGKLAGPLRNIEMADYCTHGLGFWDGESRGTANMASQLLVRNKPVRLVKMLSKEREG
jgi:YspA, cpYpsA-related SLOG family